MKRTRAINTFSLSFLDVMCCGFGAVILLVMLINGQMLQKREDTQKDLRGELDRVTRLRDFAQSHLDLIRAQVKATELEEGDLRIRADALALQLSMQREENERDEDRARRQEAELQALKDEIEDLERQRAERDEQEQNNKVAGRRRVGFDGEGRRQYLTGLKLGGDRTLILVDASASMLDETIVNVVRRSLMDESIRRRSPKWQRAVRSVHWLVANLPADRQFQVYVFDTEARAVLADSRGQWLSTSNQDEMNGTIAALRNTPPTGGTRLVAAFDVIRQLKPRPDSVILLTDGLPTQGQRPSSSNTVTADERLQLFRQAVRTLPTGVPINTILFPLEGDPSAADSFWELAVITNGSFITPSRDWP